MTNKEFWLKELKDAKRGLNYALENNSHYLLEQNLKKLAYADQVVKVNGYE